MRYSNLHTHTDFCDGKKMPENFVAEAIRQNMSSIGFSAHAPLPYICPWTIKYENIKEYLTQVNFLKTSQNKVQVYLSLELDYIPGYTIPFDVYRNLMNLDYTIGSIHFVIMPEKDLLWFIDGPHEKYIEGINTIFDNDARKAVKAFYAQTREMVLTQKPDIIGHLDKIKMNNKNNQFFTTKEIWYRDEIIKTLEVIKQNGTIVEINTRGIYRGKTAELFPSIEIIQECNNMEIPLTISSDAHNPDELTKLFSETIDILKQSGIKTLLKFVNYKWEGYSLLN
ncbi:MAG: histidinol-phosphatase [Bacteroidota bacterium]|nr:histidinol-phosphatase [Bacteroidota bacterium]